eukprot:CAMPEP_0198326976 /NCGR_PEP_ID=MMETSP1450-20131203/14352_1 /TAXON_ID=753684 ORGANISM="Madagascaria erythrocladiodes, Strain CCMP3234" /NCGR_SAMPLE_ID=MMETSP1450 /ASSEMBLY_ACC=CAM_ASM_001115 /LENGTH=80 /DNA_ID=CAMNT_0044030985 /DNA_START=280 /DNA_END=522 /DNA_ORIENTATION=-
MAVDVVHVNVEAVLPRRSAPRRRQIPATRRTQHQYTVMREFHLCVNNGAVAFLFLVAELEAEGGGEPRDHTVQALVVKVG